MIDTKEIPYAPEVERAVLGAMIIDAKVCVNAIDILRPEAFFQEKHQIIYTAIRYLFNKKQKIDMITVNNRLKETKELEKVEAPYYITELTSTVASGTHIEEHCRILLQYYMRREMIRLGSNIIQQSFDDSYDPIETIMKHQKEIDRVSGFSFKKGATSTVELKEKAIADIYEAQKAEDGIVGIKSGFARVDRFTGGWKNGDLIVIAARPGMGKTSFVLGCAKNTAYKDSMPVAFFSLEMNAKSIMNRLISDETKIPLENIIKGRNIGATEDDLLKEKTREFDDRLIIDDASGTSIMALRAKAMKYVMDNDIKLIIVDYLQLMVDNRVKAGRREEEVSNISRALKSLAKELDIPIIALSQLSREVEKRQDKIPILSDLRESGSIEQDADSVIFMFRPEYYNPGEMPGRCKMILSKHRNGRLATLIMGFEGKTARFYNVEKDDDDTGIIEEQHGDPGF